MTSIAACLIVKDGAATIVRAIESVRPHVDEVCVYDTGSTDGTLELLTALAAQPGLAVVVERGE
jgi:glycosyltransferase involved in cell wall biosynthesis